MAFSFDEAGWALGCAAAPILLGVAVGLTDMNTGAPARKARYPWPYLLWMLGLWASSVGAGLLLGRAWLSIRGSAEGFEYHSAARLVLLGALSLLIGIAALVGAVLLHARNASGAERARSIRLTGPRVPANVTESTPNRGDNTKTTLWNVALQFKDSQARSRWHTLVHHKRLPVGSRHRIRYDPEAPGQRSMIFRRMGRDMRTLPVPDDGWKHLIRQTDVIAACWAIAMFGLAALNSSHLTSRR